MALTVVITPGARKTEIVGPYGDALKIRIAAPPSDGKANSQLLRFISAMVGVPLSDVSLIFGQSARRKGILVIGVQPQQVARALTH